MSQRWATRDAPQGGLGLVRVLYTRAPVRILLVVDSSRELPFVESLLLTFAEVRAVVLGETEGLEPPCASNEELVVIARSRWTQNDTELCALFYNVRPGIPVLGVSRPCSLEDRAGALRAGADDFLTIPFEAEELVVRAMTLVRRASSGPRHAWAGPFVVDFARRLVLVEGQSIPLTLGEYDILATLIERAGEVVTRQDLAERAASAAGRHSNIVNVHVSRIREKLGTRASVIETVRGIGYRFRQT
jgi:DNA-binding response OmpR family regulator